MAVRTLRPGAPGDVDTYRTIRLASLLADPEAFASTHEREAAFGDDVWQRRLAGFDGRPGIVLVDELPADPSAAATPAVTVGTAAVGYTEWDPQPMLVGMWVRPEARRSGAGRRLVDAAVAWARQQAAGEVVLWVVRTNAAAIALYERCGFVASGAVEALPSNPCVDELEMRLAL